MDEFVLQTDSQLGQWAQVNQYPGGSLRETNLNPWYQVQVFSSLEEAQNKKTLLISGLHPGETIVG